MFVLEHPLLFDLHRPCSGSVVFTGGDVLAREQSTPTKELLQTQAPVKLEKKSYKAYCCYFFFIYNDLY
jgi:hypothetical protein